MSPRFKKFLLPVIASAAWASYGTLGDAALQAQAVRVPLSFFDRAIEAEWTVAGDPASTTAAQWVESGPEGAAPDPALGKPLADFRDQTGCLELSGLGDARLCFQVMGDVSNLGLNDREMSLSGQATAAVAQGDLNGCVANPQASANSSLPNSLYHVQGATYEAGVLVLRFVSRCAPAAQLVLRQV